MSDIDFNTLSISEITIGMTASYSQTISIEDVNAFASISGDKNPVHLDEEYAANSRFKKRIAHGLLTASFFSALFGTKLPGTGCVYVSQNLIFKRPVYINDVVEAVVIVESIDIKTKRVFFKTIAKVGGKVVIDGEAEIFIP